MKTRVTFLGTGTSQGVPLIACKCPVCLSDDTHDKRLRSSVMVETAGLCIVIDSGPDFRQQMLRVNAEKLDALIFTHEHKDHIAGMDDIRAFNYVNQKAVDIYATVQVQAALQREYQYIFSEFRYPGIPEVKIHTIANDKEFMVGNTKIIPIEVMHYKLPVLGFRINDFTYITDANFIAESEKEKIRGSKVLVLNALRREQHISHFTLQEAIDLAAELRVPEVYLTHISHQLGFHRTVDQSLPKGVRLAYDGLQVNVG